jgi:hypothetical protein
LFFIDDIDGPFCIKRITWSSPIKIFYKKSLPGLLQLVYRFIQVAVSKSLGAKLLPQRELLTLPFYLPKVITASLKGESFSPLLNVTEVHKLTGKNTNQPKKLKAVIVSRNVAKGIVAIFKLVVLDWTYILLRFLIFCLLYMFCPAYLL